MEGSKKNLLHDKSWRRYRIRENNKQDPLFIREMKVSQGLIKLRVRIYLKTISVHTNIITVKFTSKESNNEMR